MGTKHVATLCDVSGAQGLQRLQSCDVCGGVTFAHPRLQRLRHLWRLWVQQGAISPTWDTQSHWVSRFCYQCMLLILIYTVPFSLWEQRLCDKQVLKIAARSNTWLKSSYYGLKQNWNNWGVLPICIRKPCPYLVLSPSLPTRYLPRNRFSLLVPPQHTA